VLLTATNLAHYLIDRGLVTRGSVVDGDWVVVEAARRNRTFRALRRAGPGYFVKQLQDWGAASARSLECEAAVYAQAQERADAAAWLPRFYGYDRDCGILTLGLAPGENLSEYHERLGAFPVDVGAALGRALGVWHREMTPGWTGRAGAGAWPDPAPWILRAHQAGAAAPNDPSGGSAQTLDVVRRFPEFHAPLDALRDRWRATRFIHGDLKWDNCLLADGADGRPDLKIVDWEFAGLGDPGWDTGAVFQVYLSWWIGSIPPAADDSSPPPVEQATYPLEAMQPAMRAFWAAYLAQAQPDEPAADLLKRSAQYGAARLIQSAYEAMTYAPGLEPRAVAMLQVAANMLENPEDAIRYLLAL
jgi:hypothetical protein